MRALRRESAGLNMFYWSAARRMGLSAMILLALWGLALWAMG